MCSSEFIKEPWLTLLYGYNNSIYNHQKLDRPLLSKYLQTIAWLCDVSEQVIGFWTQWFNSRVTLTADVFNRMGFKSFVDGMINSHKHEVPMHNKIIIPFITEMFQGNLLPTAFNTDWIIQYGNQSNGYLAQSVPRLYMNDTCNCVVSNSCQDHLRVGPPNLILPGLVIGCSPIEGLRMSTLECFYSSDCISTIVNYLEYYAQIDGSPPIDFNPPTVLPIAIYPLDNSTESRFSPNTVISTLIDEAFIAGWINTSSYETYFNQCLPSSCQYKHTKRQNSIYIITYLLSLYGGLTVGWRFIVWNGMISYERIKRWLLMRRSIVQPISAAE